MILEARMLHFEYGIILSTVSKNPSYWSFISRQRENKIFWALTRNYFILLLQNITINVTKNQFQNLF